ncbi:DNA-3-methyladenine glycosylase 2 family protein [Coprothermobacteraceae bacterium]|nr:DNA-3-methyladenine glycosylase 2 family protein [Coprothermobacteraceae bacterium]
MNYLVLHADDEPVLTVARRDERFLELVQTLGTVQVQLEPNYFVALAQAIAGQQLSMKAADAIWRKIVNALGVVEPQRVLHCSEECLRQVGLSRSKVGYLKDLAHRVLTGELDLASIGDLDDEQVIAELTKVKGIGRWTAEMFLIFSLGRMDVFSVQDFGLRKAIKWLHDLPEIPAKSFLVPYSEKFKPYRTVLSLYLWEAINRGLVA